MKGKTITGYNPKLNATATTQGGTTSSSGYTPNPIYAGDSSSASFTTESLGWRIWGIDANNIYLISATPTTKTLKLGGAQGYNNGVYILNEICRTCYTDNDYSGATVRSMDIRDIEKLYDKGIMTYNYENYSGYNTTPNPYEFTWPTQWYDNDQNDTKPFENRSKQDRLIESGSATKEKSILSPTWTFWFNSFGSAGSHTDFGESDEAKAYASMIFDNSSSNLPTYWLASRYVNPNSSSYCRFGLQYVYSR